MIWMLRSWSIFKPAYSHREDIGVVVSLDFLEMDCETSKNMFLHLDKDSLKALEKICKDVAKTLGGKKITRGKWSAEIIKMRHKEEEKGKIQGLYG